MNGLGGNVIFFSFSLFFIVSLFKGDQPYEQILYFNPVAFSTAKAVLAVLSATALNIFSFLEVFIKKKQKESHKNDLRM